MISNEFIEWWHDWIKARSTFARCWRNFLQLSLWEMCCMGHNCFIKLVMVIIITINIVMNRVWYFYLTMNLSPWKPEGHHYSQYLRFWEFWPTAITQAVTAAACARYRLCALQDIFHLILRRSLQSMYHYPFLQLRTQSLRNWLNCRKVCGAVGIYPGSICLYVCLSETAMSF